MVLVLGGGLRLDLGLWYWWSVELMVIAWGWWCLVRIGGDSVLVY